METMVTLYPKRVSARNRISTLARATQRKKGNLQATHSEYGRQKDSLRPLHMKVPDQWYWKAQKHYVGDDMWCRRAHINRKKGNVAFTRSSKGPDFVDRNTLKYYDK